MSCFRNEPLGSKSNYPFYFLTQNTYVIDSLPISPKPHPKTTTYIKRALWKGGGDSGQAKWQTWKRGHSSRSQLSVKKYKIRSGKFKQKEPWGKGSSDGTEWGGRSGDIFFKPELKSSYKRRETKARINLPKEQTKTQLNKNIKMIQTLPPLVFINEEKIGCSPNIYLWSCPQVRHSVPVQLYL